MPAHEAEEIVTEQARFVATAQDAALVLEAVGLMQRASISVWDAMIVRAAARMGCEVLLTEDLNHGEVIDGVRVENPFHDLPADTPPLS